MKQSWDDYDKAAEHGPLSMALKWVILGGIVCGVIAAIGFGFELIGRTAEVAHQEFGAKASLAKYEWFKDAAAQLQKKQADIRVYEGRLHTLTAAYGDEPHSQWDRTDKEAYGLAVTEIAGIKASYNALAAEYNSQSSKFNWKFAQGDLPQIIQPLEVQ